MADHGGFSRLAADDEDLIERVGEWAQEPSRTTRKAILVLTRHEHAVAVTLRLCEEGWLKVRSDQLQSPMGDTLFVRTSGNMMSGIAIDEVFIHPDCPQRVADALLPCVRARG